MKKKALKRNTYVLKLCTFPRHVMTEITRNRNEYTKSVKCSHFGIFGVVNRPYFVSQTILKLFYFKIIFRPRLSGLPHQPGASYLHLNSS